MKEPLAQRSASLGFGVVLVVLGVLFLLAQWVGVRFWEAGWPLIIVAGGLVFFVGMITGGKAAGGLAIPGSIVTTVGLILLYQNTFNHYESWSYAWALIPLAVGIGSMINGYWSDQPEEVEKGRRVAGIGGVLFLIGFVFFEFVVGIGRFGPRLFGGIVGPLLLVAIGIYLVLRNVWSIRTQPPTTPPEPPRPYPAPEDALWTKASALPSSNSQPPPTTSVPLITQPPVDNGKEEAIAEKV